jgi:hypothetical protein
MTQDIGEVLTGRAEGKTEHEECFAGEVVAAVERENGDAKRKKSNCKTAYKVG